jgi:hypothetical protein
MKADILCLGMWIRSHTIYVTQLVFHFQICQFQQIFHLQIKLEFRYEQNNKSRDRK